MGRKAAIAAISIIAVMVATLLLVRGLQGRYVILYTYTDDAGGLTEGTSVRLNGIGIGDLDSLTLTNSRDPQRKIRFAMKVRATSLAQIPQDSLVGVAASNLLGNYFIDIIRGKSSQTVQPGGELQSTASVDPNRLMAQMGSELQQIQAIFDRFGKLVTDTENGQGNIGKWEKEGVGQLDSLSAEFARLQDDLQNGHGSLSKIGDLKADMDAPQRRLNDLMGAYQAGQGTAGKLQTLTTELQEMNKEVNGLSAELNSDRSPGKRIAEIQERFTQLQDRFQGVMDRVNAGQGTLGQFTVNSQFSEALAGAGKEFQTLAKDIKANPRKFLSLHVQLF